jgi:hypothetical protein
MTVASGGAAAGSDGGRGCLLGGESRRRGVLGSWGPKALLAAGAYGVVAVLVMVTAKSLAALVVLAAVPAAAWVISQRVTSEGDAWLARHRDRLVAVLGARTGASRYRPQVAADGRVVLPRELGRVEFLGVAPIRGRAELAVVRHGTQYLSTTLEVIGGGDGLREPAETDRLGVRFGRLLYAVSRPDVPVDQLDLSTRVIPVAPGEYHTWVEEHLNPQAGPVLAANLRDLAGRVQAAGEAYRTFLTLSMPLGELSRRAALRGPVDADGLAQAAYEATGQVAREAARQGLQVRQGLTPRRLAGLIRHLYAPSYGIDDAGDLDSPRQAWPPYTAHRDAVQVHGADGSTWWHATASVPRDGWPLRPVGVRWLETLVTEVNPRVIRTITVQHRLLPKVQTRQRAALANTLDQAEVLAQQKRGRVSTGEREAQAAGSALVLHDLLYESAAGDRPQLRVTVTAGSRAELVTARQQIEAAMQDSDITRVRWYDHRHHHALLLTLPLGRGIKR